MDTARSFLEGLDRSDLKRVIEKYRAVTGSKVDKRGGAAALVEKILANPAYVDAIAADDKRAVIGSSPPVSRTVSGMIATLFGSRRTAQKLQEEELSESVCSSSSAAAVDRSNSAKREYVDRSRWINEPAVREALQQEFIALMNRGSSSAFYKDLVASDMNRILRLHITGCKYGHDDSINKEPWTECNGSKWYNSRDRGSLYFGPRNLFTPSSLRVFPIPYEAEDGREMVLFQHDGPRQEWWFDGPLEEWQRRLADWQQQAPNIKAEDKSNPFEEEAVRSRATSNHATILQCFDAVRCIGYPSLSSPIRPRVIDKTWLKTPQKDFPSYSKSMSKFNMFRIDMYGNLIALPTSVGGLASNNSLTFFDLDHIFPFCRGGRSVCSNFAAVQCVANRTVKSDNLLQTLSPRQMNCGIMASQLISMVEWVEEKFGRERNTKNSLLDSIIGWLTKSPMNSDAFTGFQNPIGSGGVGYTVNALVLLQYFGNRQEREYQRILAIGRALGGGVGGGGADACDVSQLSLLPEVAAEVALRAEGHQVESEPSKETQELRELRVRTEIKVTAGHTDMPTHRVVVSGCTFHHRVELRVVLGFSFAYEATEGGRQVPLWYKHYFCEKELECILTDLGLLASENGLKFVDEDTRQRRDSLGKRLKKTLMRLL